MARDFYLRATVFCMRLMEQLSCQGSEPQCTSSCGPKSPTRTDFLTPPCDVSCIRLLPIAMSEKLNFAIREGGRTVGAGVVTKIIE